MKLAIPEFVLSVMAEQACSLLDVCEIVEIDRDGRLAGDVSGVEVVMLPWSLPPETLRLLLEASSLRWVHTVSVGIDHALSALPAGRQVIITNAHGVFDIPIAEMALTFILALSKRLREFNRQQQARTWHLLRLREAVDLTIGIVGLGNIGKQIAARCKALGMRVIAVRRHPDQDADRVDELFPSDELPELLRRSDFVVLAVPLTDETRGMIGEAQLRQMRPEAWLINIARGAIVDSQALLRALTEGWIAGAALDVFEQEPLPATSPFWSLPNVLITPHNSWSTPHLKQREAELFIDNLRRYLQHEPLLNVIDRSRGY